MKRDLAEQLRAAIRESGLSANELAEKCGVPQTTISRFLRGNDMGIHRASRIASHLGIELRKKS